MFKKLVVLAAAMCLIFSMSSMVFAEGESADTPIYLTYEGEELEVDVPAASELYYASYGVSGTTLTVTGADAYVIYDGEKIEAVDGVVEVDVVSASPRYPVNFQIGNAGTEDATYSVNFVYPLGSQMNPEIIEDSSSIRATIEAGNTQGYLVRFIAPADGTFCIDIYGAEDDEYNELGWQYVVNNMTTYIYGDTHWSDDDPVVSSVELEVSEGDEIEINLSTYDPANPYSAPAGYVNAYVSFTYPEGTENNPIGIYDIPAELTVDASSSNYYQGYFAGMIVTIDSDKVSVVYNGETYTAEDGVITIECPAQGMGRPMPDVFQIINEGTADVEISVDAKYPAGHMENPDKLVIGSNQAQVAAGNNQGYYYIWTATEKCLLTLKFDAESDWLYTVNNMTSYVYGDTVWSDSDPAMPTITIAVDEGDEIQVIVNTYNPEDEWNTPAGTVKFEASIITEDELAEIIPNDSEEYESIQESATSDSTTTGSKLVISVVDMADIATVKDLAAELFEDIVYQMVDIKLVDANDQVIQPTAGQVVNVTMNVPSALGDATKVEVFWLNDGELESLGKVDVTNGKITFAAKHFSTYVFADATPAPVVTPPPTNAPDTADMAPIAMIIVIAAVAAVVVLKKRAVEN